MSLLRIIKLLPNRCICVYVYMCICLDLPLALTIISFHIFRPSFKIQHRNFKGNFTDTLLIWKLRKSVFFFSHLNLPNIPSLGIFQFFCQLFYTCSTFLSNIVWIFLDQFFSFNRETTSKGIFYSSFCWKILFFCSKLKFHLKFSQLQLFQ